MTDNELIRVLRCCVNDDCDNCPSQVVKCKQHAMLNALDLIKRQQAEIDRFADTGKMYSEVRVEAIGDLVDRLNAIAERNGEYGYGRTVYIEEIKAVAKKLTEDTRRGTIEDNQDRLAADVKVY